MLISKKNDRKKKNQNVVGFSCWFVLFGFYIAFNILSVICLNVAGSSMFSFRVLPHGNITPQTHDVLFHQSEFTDIRRTSSSSTFSMLSSKRKSSYYYFKSLWYDSAGVRTHNLSVTKRSLYLLSHWAGLLQL